MNDDPTVVLDGLVDDQSGAWNALLEIAPHLGEDWTLIGGQMVALHQAERRAYVSDDLRPSFDVDVVVNIRSGRRAVAHFDGVLRSHGFVQVPADIEHRYRRADDGVIFDVLAPDHLGIHLPRSLLIISQNRGIMVAKPQVRDLRFEGKRHYSAVS